jgi:hypothetical protein
VPTDIKQSSHKILAKFARSQTQFIRGLDVVTDHAENVADDSWEYADSVVGEVDEADEPSDRVPDRLDEDPPAQIRGTSLRANAATLLHLQHEVAEKTLALQSLQQEHDSLLQNLERMQAERGTIERDSELWYRENMTEEKERLQEQVRTLEQRREENQKSRDEVRQMGAEQASQHLKKVELAGSRVSVIAKSDIR